MRAVLYEIRLAAATKAAYVYIGVLEPQIGGKTGRARG